MEKLWRREGKPVKYRESKPYMIYDRRREYMKYEIDHEGNMENRYTMIWL